MADSVARGAIRLEDVVLINESSAEDIPGAIDVFCNERAACNALEHWWVEEGIGFAFAANGERILLGIADGVVVVKGREPHPNGRAIVHRLLTAHAAGIAWLLRGGEPAGGAVDMGPPPTSIEDLITYVGLRD